MTGAISLLQRDASWLFIVSILGSSRTLSSISPDGRERKSTLPTDPYLRLVETVMRQSSPHAPVHI